MTDEAKHPREVPGYEGRLDELVENLGKLDYRTLKTILDGLGDDLLAQARADERRGREQLASALYESSRSAHRTVEVLDRVCRICEPYMPKNSK
ncbi:Uncharacterised protein [uncultured archaeon]|nr:Uncharacterised protein [uncultured archaeon]